MTGLKRPEHPGDAMTDRDGRVEITSEQYFVSLDPKLGVEVRSVIDDLIEWSHESELVEYFSTFGLVPINFDPLMEKLLSPLEIQVAPDVRTLIALVLSIAKLTSVIVFAATVTWGFTGFGFA